MFGSNYFGHPYFGQSYAQTVTVGVFEPFRPPIGQAVGDEALTAHSRIVGGLAAQGIIATPILRSGSAGVTETP